MQEEEGVGMGTPAALHQVQAHAHTPTHAHVRHAQQGRFAFKAPASASPPVHLALAGTSPTAYARDGRIRRAGVCVCRARAQLR